MTNLNFEKATNVVLGTKTCNDLLPSFNPLLSPPFRHSSGSLSSFPGTGLNCSHIQQAGSTHNKQVRPQHTVSPQKPDAAGKSPRVAPPA